MNTIMSSKSPHDSSLSISKRYFNWKNKSQQHPQNQNPHYQEHQQISSFNLSARFNEDDLKKNPKSEKKPSPSSSSSKLRTVLTVLGRIRSSHQTRVVGTLFGRRRGHVYFAIQEDPKQDPAFLIELPTATSVLVREMASGQVRIALECEKRRKCCRLVDEALWRTYCNGKKCGYAARRESGAAEQKILKAVEPITMGAGVVPAAAENGADGSELGELMYMRARFERVIGSKDSEAFYMMSPDCCGGPELSIYLLRV